MRFRFNALTRPLALAGRLESVFPALGHQRAMAWSAMLNGYRDWHDLQVNTQPGQEVTADLRYVEGDFGREILSEDREEMLIRHQARHMTLLRLVGAQLPAWDLLLEYLWPKSVAQCQYQELGKTCRAGKGHAFFRGLALDLFQRASSDGGLPTTEAPQGVLLFAQLPSGIDEQQMLALARVFVRDVHSSGLEGDEQRTALECLADGRFGESHLDVHFDGDESDNIATQSRSIRFWAMRGEELVGFAVVSLAAKALQHGNEALLQVELRCAAGTFLQREYLEHSLDVIELHVNEALERLTWMRVASAERAFIAVVVRATTIGPAAAPLARALPKAMRAALGRAQAIVEDITFMSDS